MTIGKSEYWGLGIIVAPKNQHHGGAIIINFLVWEISFKWGHDEKLYKG
jgi:hypothetical protein